ncbi:MAG TPA: hypothetical protein VKS79_21125 [Gemmataceae bacterium]|nr:hypothetical protein [Gemmataceae bacterium]
MMTALLMLALWCAEPPQSTLQKPHTKAKLEAPTDYRTARLWSKAMHVPVRFYIGIPANTHQYVVALTVPPIGPMQQRQVWECWWEKGEFVGKRIDNVAAPQPPAANCRR